MANPVLYSQQILQQEISYDPVSGFFWRNGNIPKKIDTSNGDILIYSEFLNAASAAYAYMTGEYKRFVSFKDGDKNNLKFENLEV